MLSNILFFSQLYTQQNGGNPFRRLNFKVQKYKKKPTWNNFSKNYIFTLPITPSVPAPYPLRLFTGCLTTV